MTARWIEAYSLAEEKAARARVRLIISGLEVACAMSWESESSETISALYSVTVCWAPLTYAFLRISSMPVSWRPICRMLLRIDLRVSSLSSVLSTLSVAASKALAAASVWSRTPWTRLLGLPSLVTESGPADLSRSSWSMAARLVACRVIVVSSCMCSSCAMSFNESLMRKPPSVVAATTGRVSSDTSRVLMRQFCMARREPGPLGAFGIAASLPSAGSSVFALPRGLRRAFAFTVVEESEPAPSTAGPRFWACWGEEPRSVPPRGSCSAAALPSLLNRPCTSVATSGPGVPPGDRWDGVESWGVSAPWWSSVTGASPSPCRRARRCVAPPARRLFPRRSREFQHSGGSPTRCACRPAGSVTARNERVTPCGAPFGANRTYAIQTRWLARCPSRDDQERNDRFSGVMPLSSPKNDHPLCPYCQVAGEQTHTPVAITSRLSRGIGCLALPFTGLTDPTTPTPQPSRGPETP